MLTDVFASLPQKVTAGRKNITVVKLKLKKKNKKKDICNNNISDEVCMQLVILKKKTKLYACLYALVSLTVCVYDRSSKTNLQQLHITSATSNS